SQPTTGLCSNRPYSGPIPSNSTSSPVDTSRLNQNTVDTASGVWSSRWISAEVTPKSAAVSSRTENAVAAADRPRSSDDTQSATTTTWDTRSAIAMIAWAAPTHATPRLIFVLNQGPSATLLADSTTRPGATRSQIEKRIRRAAAGPRARR